MIFSRLRRSSIVEGSKKWFSGANGGQCEPRLWNKTAKTQNKETYSPKPPARNERSHHGRRIRWKYWSPAISDCQWQDRWPANHSCYAPINELWSDNVEWEFTKWTKVFKLPKMVCIDLSTDFRMSEWLQRTKSAAECNGIGRYYSTKINPTCNQKNLICIA